jgi:hypothetical protein
VTGIHIDVPVGPLPVLPCAPRNNGSPYECRLRLPDHVLSEGSFGQHGRKTAGLDKFKVE